MRVAMLDWWVSAAAALDRQAIHQFAYVPDNRLDPLIRVLEAEPRMKVVLATREEEAIGIGAGMALGGGRPAVLMQSSGLGNTLNAIGSLLIPYRIPLLLLISLRGDRGEWNIAQAALGRGSHRIMEAIGILHFDLGSAGDVERVLSSAADRCFGESATVAVFLRSSLGEQ